MPGLPICTERLRVLGLVALTALAFALPVSNPAQAQPLADRVPQDALLYLGWAGTEALGPQYAESNLKKLHELSGEARLLTTLIDTVVPALDDLDLPRSRELETVKELLTRAGGFIPTLSQKPTAFYVVTSPEFNPGMGMAMVLLIEAGDDAPAMAQTINELIQPLQDRAARREKVDCQAVDGVVRFILAPQWDEQAFGEELTGAGPAAPLAEAEAFQLTAKQVGATPAMLLFANLELFEARLHGSAERDAPPEILAQYRSIRDTLGLQGLKHLLLATGFDGPGWTTQVFLHAPGPRTGVVGLLDQQALDADALNHIPKDALFAAAGRFDLVKLIETAKVAADTIEPGAGKQIDQALHMASGSLGSDVQTELLPALGDVWTLQIDPGAVGHSPLGLMFSMPLKQPETIDETLNNIMLMANAGFTAMINRPGGPKLGFHDAEVGDMKLWSFPAVYARPSLSVHDGHLRVGLFPQSVVHAAEQAQAAHRAGLPQLEAVRVAYEKTKGQTLTGLVMLDLPRLADQGYGAQLFLTQALASAGVIATGQDMPLGPPPLAKLKPLLSPVVLTTSTSQAGWHLRVDTPYPGATFAGGSIAASMSAPLLAPVGVGILVPAIAQARASARMTQDMSMMRQIAVAQFAHQADHGGDLTDQLKTLTESGYMSPDAVSPYQHRVLLLAGIHPAQLPRPSETIAGFMLPQPGQEIYQVSFADGHVERRTKHRLDQQLRAQTSRSLDDWINEGMGLH